MGGNRGPALVTRIAILLALCLLVSLVTNLVLVLHEDGVDYLATFRARHIQLADALHVDNIVPANESLPSSRIHTPGRSRLAGLSCERFGGPSDDVAAQMVYWRDIPSDAEFVSPFFDENRPEKYLLWDMDVAGFNNKRITFENFFLMAHAMGRTLVMPPKSPWIGFNYMVCSY